MSWRKMKGEALRELVESQGLDGALDIIQECLNEGSMRPEDFSLQEIWAATERNADGSVRSYSEAVSSDMFPEITGSLINSTVIKAYEAVTGVADRLCETVSAKHEIEKYAGFNASEMPEEVQQGRPYNSSDLGEKYVTIPHTKYGRLIDVTEEMVYFDQTGQVISRAKGIGRKAAQYREKLIIEGVQDINSNVFRPSGTPAAFYRTAASGDRPANSASSTPFGEAGLRTAMQLFHNMTDENSDYIMIDEANLIGLFPFDLWVEVKQMQKSTLTPEGNENAVNVWKGVFEALTSPYITAQSSSTWYLGDFRNSFVWSEVWPLQTFSLPGGGEMGFRADIKSLHKVRFYGQIGAVDDHYCLKMTA